MGGSASKFSDKDIETLKTSINRINTKLNELDTTVKDEKQKIGEALADKIDYSILSKKLDSKDFANAVAAANINTDDLATAIARNPGSLGDALSQKITSTPALMTPIATSLADNTTFAKTLSDLLTSPTEAYLEKLRGQKGETGNLASSKATIKESLYDKKYTMWCADGDFCELPVGTKGIKLGPWIFESMPWGNMHVHKGDPNQWSFAISPDHIHSRAGGGVTIGDWKIKEEGEGHLVFNKNNEGQNSENKPHLRMAGDGNFWVSRSSGPGWVADNIGELRNKTQRLDGGGNFPWGVNFGPHWHIRGSWWHDDGDTNNALYIEKLGKNGGAKMLVDASGKVQASDNFRSDKWNKWM
jgi:hypothetical protein